MTGMCGANCDICGNINCCKGCKATNGSPFGGKCIAAEYIKIGEIDAFNQFKKQLISEINALSIDGMPKVDELYCLCGSYINMEYPLPNGETVKLLKDKNIYLGTQVDCKFVDRCFGIVTDTNFILVCEYGENGINPEIVLYTRR